MTWCCVRCCYVRWWRTLIWAGGCAVLGYEIGWSSGGESDRGGGESDRGGGGAEWDGGGPIS